MFTPRPLLRALPRLPLPARNATPLLRRLTTIPRRPPSTHTSPPLTAAARRAEAASHKRRQAVLTLGCLMSMSALWLITRTIDISVKTESLTPGAPTILTTPAEKAAGVELIPSGTTSVPPFPKTLVLEGTEYALIGLGIRTVSFLGIEVYVVGVYAAAEDLGRLQEALLRRVHPSATAATQGEAGELRRVLGDEVEGEAFWEELLREKGVRSLLRIVPTRNTDYQHLRDGWVRGIQARSSKSPRYDDDQFAAALTSFKAAFGQKKAVPKQKTLLLLRDADGGLKCFYDASGRNDGKVGGKGEKALQLLGSVGDERVGTALWLCYLAGKKVASEPARKSVIEGLVELVERPMGTVGAVL